jgi:hypothetical protein
MDDHTAGSRLHQPGTAAGAGTTTANTGQDECFTGNGGTTGIVSDSGCSEAARACYQQFGTCKEVRHTSENTRTGCPEACTG